ncbi:MAG TPA: tRNA lysidine(34) synthetase TilS, partial [Lachnospiraceae bacterium]
MKNKIRKFIEKENMIEEGDRIVLALSGGADSVYLFFLFLELKEELKFTFACAHLNHQIRGADADADEKFVKDLCDCHNIPIYLYRKDVTSYAQKYRYTIEEAGRKLRYQVFEETKKAFGGNKIALAHHSNDLAETLLFNLA